MAPDIPGQWQQLDDQTEVLRVWEVESNPDSWPEIALLRVQPNRYQEFLQNPAALYRFVNDNSIFRNRVRTNGPAMSLAGVGTETPSGYLFVLSHSRTSAMLVGGLPLLTQGNY